MRQRGRPRRPYTTVREGDCLRCTSHPCQARGYPVLRRNGIQVPIARLILFEKYGEQPSEVMAQHTCGHKWCVNPEHIVMGTRSSVAKLRGRTYTKISDEDVNVIRQLLEVQEATQAEIAKMFGVTSAHISLIKHGRSRADSGKEHAHN